MSRPLSQVFTVNSPVGGASSIGIAAAALYFSSISDTKGVSVQIREVANGVPVPCVVRNSYKSIQLSDLDQNGVKRIRASSDGTVATQFPFDKTVILKTNQQYALCVMPDCGDSSYVCWGGKLLDIDTLSQVPIQFNQYIGPLFFYSNDKVQTSTSDQAIKFLLIENQASFPRYHIDCHNFNEEHFICNEFTKSFVIGETVYMSNDSLDLAYTTIASNVGSFINGEAFFQSNGSANISTGFIFSANAQVLLLDQIIGSVTNTYQLKGVSSGANAILNTINTSIICSNSSTTVTLPFTGNNTSTLLAANQSFYLTSNDESISETFIVTGISVDNKTISLSWPPSFSDSNAEAGIIRGGGLALKMVWQGYDGTRFNNFTTHCSDSTANTRYHPDFHFANSHGCYLFGITSKARCRSYGTIDLDYHAVVPHVWTDKAQENDHKLYWGGVRKKRVWNSEHPESWRYDTVSHSASKQQQYWTDGAWEYVENFDENYGRILRAMNDNNSVNYDPYYEFDQSWDFSNECENEYSDGYRRCWKSRSHEWIDNDGQRSVWFRHRCKMANTFVIPDIDPVASWITLTINLLFKDEETYGYRLSYSNNYGFFLPGDSVSQTNDEGTSFGNIYRMDANFVYVNICTGKFKTGYSVYNDSIHSVNTFAIGSVEMNEKFSANVFPGQSRYMSKSVILADQQDAEDLKVIFTAYRPSTTNFKIYGKIIASQDTSLYDDRIWSRLLENNLSVSLFSSDTNLNDFIEISYDFPQSNIVFAPADGCSCNIGNLQVSVLSSDIFLSNSYIYITDTTSGVFNVRQIDSVTNNSVITLTDTPTFTNANVTIGIIPNIEDKTAAFLYDQNNNIVRYVRDDDAFFDSFKKFAVKIVPISDSPVIVPRLADMRCLALQV